MSQEGSLADTVIIDECDLQLECKIVYKQSVDKNMICEEIRECIYSNEDYHVLYFAEIIKQM